ncbi:hypothetical protein QBC35DRAFT_171770 [Podospora australis]|uniref:Uncharacterized protein n=1 Tax=Podospora australis TaxID=1536484 RepID=A0AAN6WVR4_9PEZI|nr:hypothetical protein QBC35DRAFT_171770 [Podospora australis]
MATAAPILPTQPWGMLDGMPPIAMYPPDDQEFVLRTQRASERIQQMTGAHSGYKDAQMNGAPMVHMPTAYADGSAPAMERQGMGVYNRPRRLSSNSTASTAPSSVLSDRDSFDQRPRSSSVVSSSQTSIDSWAPAPGTTPRPSTANTTPTTWQMQKQMKMHMQQGGNGQSLPWQRPAPIKQRRKAAPGELFAALPGEVLELILEEVRNLHLKPGTNSCATCWMRDCCSVAISARKFVKYAREALYKEIHLVGHEGHSMKKRTKTTYGSRLVLLRRTLRANAQIAVIVRTLKPPALPQGVGLVEYNDLVASVIMACPNLERLVGHYPNYNHSFQRIFHALSTRQKLKEMNWILEPSPAQRQQRSRPTGPTQHWGPPDLDPRESRGFLDFHLDWKQLTTLVIHCQLGATLSPRNLLDRTTRALPALQNLYLSHLPHTAFSDAHLLILPPLKKLSLAHCTGITTGGLSTMATRRTSASLQTLTLMHMNVESLPAIARLFLNLTSLETFNIVQTYAPNMPADEFIMLFPYLASRTLKKLHWDIPFLPAQATAADTILAKSIGAGGFPALRTICTPNDPEGIFQALCQPRERIDLPGDRYRGGQVHRPGLAWQGFGHTRNSSSFSSQAGSFRSGIGGGGGGSNASPVSPFFPPDIMLPRDNSDLHQARMAAQARIEAARRFPRYFVNVVDEHGATGEKFGIGAFLGTVESKIRYVLAPDTALGATDEGGGLVSVEDMLRDDGGEALILGSDGNEKSSKDKKSKRSNKSGERESGAENDLRTRDGCIGRWNTYSGNVVDKKDKERWCHTERGRWRQAILS